LLKPQPREHCNDAAAFDPNSNWQTNPLQVINPSDLPAKAKAAEPENKVFFKRLARLDPRRLDTVVHRLHEEVFEKLDCLQCANCCKTLGPRITDSDISRISASLRVKPARFMDDYLVKDEDGDYVFRTMPCPFLDAENYCSIYAVRPRACREYPHTDRTRFYQLLPLTLKNSFTCPAVFEIIEKLKTEIR
jgi:Fe-S-cluster containining protein